MRQDKPRLREIIAYEKTQMLPLNFMVSYILVPIYVVVSLLLIGAFGILMEIDDQKHLVPGLLCLGAMALISIVLLASVPFVRRKTIRTELNRYEFDTSAEIPRQVYDFSTEDFSLKFDQFGMYVNEDLFYYNHLQKNIITNNYCRRVNIYIQFALDEDHTVTLPLNGVTIKMLESLEINLDNNHILAYILSNKEKAFQQIYDKGTITTNEQHEKI